MSEKFYMWKELKEVPSLIRYNLEHFSDSSDLDLSVLKPHRLNHIKIIASGSSNNVAHAARFIFEELTNIPTSVEYASEFINKSLVVNDKTLIIGISQSGKTSDTLTALTQVKESSEHHVLSITNVKSSPIFNISDSTILIGAGEEKAIPATKTFSLQLLSIFNLALLIAKIHGLENGNYTNIFSELQTLPDTLNKVLLKENELKDMAEFIVQQKHLVILASEINYSIAREGALKFKETSYIDANGYPAGEFMHGYMAMLDKYKPVLVLDNSQDTSLIANITRLQEKSSSPLLGLAMSNDNSDLYDQLITIPKTKSKIISSFVFTTCLQMMAFYGSVCLGYNPDKPRGLTKYLDD